MATNGICMNVSTKSFIYISWDITPRSPLKINRRFRGTRCLHLRGQKISQTRNQHEADIYLLPVPRWFLAWLILLPRRWKQAPSKRRCNFNGLHDVTSQKILITIAVRTSHPTISKFLTIVSSILILRLIWLIGSYSALL
jgi:hypothetical protein